MYLIQKKFVYVICFLFLSLSLNSSCINLTKGLKQEEETKIINIAKDSIGVKNKVPENESPVVIMAGTEKNSEIKAENRVELKKIVLNQNIESNKMKNIPDLKEKETSHILNSSPKNESYSKKEQSIQGERVENAKEKQPKNQENNQISFNNKTSTIDLENNKIDHNSNTLERMFSNLYTFLTTPFISLYSLFSTRNNYL
jgi:hypothetical protein